VGVGDRQDAGRQRDVAAGQAVGVAVAVVVLVVVAHDPGDRLQARDLPDQRRAGNGVVLDHLALVVLQWAGLEQDGVGDAHLADVVQPGREAQVAQLAPLQPQPLTDPARQLDDAVGVLARRAVAQPERAREHVDGRRQQRLVWLGAAPAESRAHHRELRGASVTSC